METALKNLAHALATDPAVSSSTRSAAEKLLEAATSAEVETEREFNVWSS